MAKTEPVRVLADSAYGSGEFRAELADRRPCRSGQTRSRRVPRLRAGSPSMTSSSTTPTAP